MDIRTLELISRPVQAARFTGDNAEELRQWVQGKLAFQQIVANEAKFYLPSVGGMDILEPGDWIFYDEVDNVFRGATDEAVQSHYSDTTNFPKVGETSETEGQ